MNVKGSVFINLVKAVKRTLHHRPLRRCGKKESRNRQSLGAVRVQGGDDRTLRLFRERPGSHQFHP